MVRSGSLCSWCALAVGLALHILAVLMSPKKDETAVHCCDPALSVLVMFGVLKRLSRGLAVYCLHIFVFCFPLITSLVDTTLAAFIVCGPLEFLINLKLAFTIFDFNVN